jgi:hypothetical protein
MPALAGFAFSGLGESSGRGLRTPLAAVASPPPSPVWVRAPGRSPFLGPGTGGCGPVVTEPPVFGAVWCVRKNGATGWVGLTVFVPETTNTQSLGRQAPYHV